MGQPEILQQALVALGFFERIQVLPLQVFDQRHHGGIAVVHFPLHCRDFVQAGQHRRAEPPFAGDDLVAVLGGRVRSDQYRLQQALDADRLRQVFQFGLVEVHAWLEGVGVDLVHRDGDHRDPLFRARLKRRIAQQRGQSASKSGGIFLLLMVADGLREHEFLFLADFFRHGVVGSRPD